MKCVTRKEDMSPDGRLRVFLQADGDVILSIVPASDGRCLNSSVEFCALTGGGRSPHTRKALLALMDAIRKDNEADPNEYSGNTVI